MFPCFDDSDTMLEIKTKGGKNAYDLALETKNNSMIDILKSTFEYDKEKHDIQLEEKRKTRDHNFQGAFSEVNLRRYWTLCATYFYKYSATYRLHFTKFLIKRLAHSTPYLLQHSYSVKTDEAEAHISLNEEILAFSDRRNHGLKSSFLTKYSYKRSSETVATDIRTFWKLKRGDENPAFDILLQKEVL